MSNELYCSSTFEDHELNYYLVSSRYLNTYGVGITSKKNETVKSAICYNITEVQDEAVELLKFLHNTSTFPTTLNDMVEDWFYDKL